MKLTRRLSKERSDKLIYEANLPKGAYLITYQNYFGEQRFDTIRTSSYRLERKIYVDKLIRPRKNFLRDLSSDTIFVRNELQACRYSKELNFTITHENGRLYLTTYIDNSYFPDTSIDKTPLLNGTAFTFKEPKLKVELNKHQQEMVNNFLNELVAMTRGGNWTSSDIYLYKIGNGWKELVDNKGAWTGATVLMKQLRIAEE